MGFNGFLCWKLTLYYFIMEAGFLTCYNSLCLPKSVARDRFKIAHIMVAGWVEALSPLISFRKLMWTLESCLRKKLMLPPFQKCRSIWPDKKGLVSAVQIRTLFYKTLPMWLIIAFQSDLHPADVVAVSNRRLDFWLYMISCSCTALYMLRSRWH